MVLLRAGAESDRKTHDGLLPIAMAPDKSVRPPIFLRSQRCFDPLKVRQYILQTAEREDIDMTTP